MVDVKTSESGEEYTEVEISDSPYTRRWRGETEGFKHRSQLAKVGSLGIQSVEEFGDEQTVYLKGVPGIQKAD